MAVLIERDVMVPVRDGARLATDLIRPDDDGRYPALLERTPYGKASAPGKGAFEEAAARGFVLVTQDCRGCGTSDGQFAPLIQERADGHDAINWIAEQPWSNGRVGIWGASYCGVTSLQATVDAPDALRCAIGSFTSGDYRESWRYVGDAIELGFNLRWIMGQAQAQLARPHARIPTDVAAAIREEADRFRRDPRAFFGASLALEELAPASCSVLDGVDRFLRPPDPGDPIWAATDLIGNVDRVHVPVLAITGWNDGFQLVSFAEALMTHGDARVRDEHRLVVGPWDHESYLSPMTATLSGGRDFGAAARAEFRATSLDWFEQWLHDRFPTPPRPRVRYFAMGPDRWVDAPHWPPAADPRTWSLMGDGTLAEAHATAGPSGRISFDLTDPAPTVGGRILLYPYTHGGFQDQTPREARADVLVYTSAPLADPLTIAGPMSCTVFARGTGTSGDIVVTLVDVDLDGTGWCVADGVRRVEWQVGGAPEFVVVDLWDTAYTVPAGHRLRVDIATASFPRIDRNRASVEPGTARGSLEIVHDPEHPSALVLPVARR